MASLLSGDRRWGQTRKSGMTVLGKVPKPVNLPSQRLENHGVDPNVEIVPKGTLTWGSRPALATPNVWGSSSISSPNTDGDGSSPSFSRPSTATSDKSHQTGSAAWGPNSRPSSASGVLPTDQILVAASRPRSAETRHTGAQRFHPGESAPESSAWAPSRIPERLAFASKPNAFNLSSGDFPTLGAEKTPKSSVLSESDSSRPASASGRVNVEKETVDFSSPGSEVPTKGNVNTWKAEAFPHDSWRRDQPHAPPPHQNMIAVPQYPLDWPGPHMVNTPEGLWYRGPPPGGMFRPGGPGAYPVDPYLFYPQIPARPMPGSATVAYGPMNGPPYPPQHAVFDGPVLGFVPPQSTLRNASYGPRSKPDSGDVQAELFTAPAPSKADIEVEDGQRPKFRVLLKQHDRWKDSSPAADPVVAQKDDVKDESDSEKTKFGPSSESERAGDPRAEDPKRLPSFKRSSLLMEKIEGLNSKARAVDGRSGKQNQAKEGLLKNIDEKRANVAEVAVKSVAVPEEKSELSSASSSTSSAVGSPSQGHRPHGLSKSRLSDKKCEESKNKSLLSSSVVPIARNAINCQTPFQDVTDKGDSDEGKVSEKPHAPSVADSEDLKAQHARMKEMARQRAQQLQREEEERTREQKARALAKLEELNRRISAPSENSKEHLPNQPTDNVSGATENEGSVAVVPEEQGKSVPDVSEVQEKSAAESSVVAKPKPSSVQKRRHHNSGEEKRDIIPGGVLVGSIVVGTKHLAADSVVAEKQPDELPSPAPHKKKTHRNRNRPDDSTRKEKLAAASLVASTVALATAVSVEEGSSKAGTQWKPQHSRKVTRNPSTARSVDQFHGTEATVVWAPVKPVGSKKNEPLPTPPPPPPPPEDVVELARSKSKRAEMERYVPKPAIGQEASQQNAGSTSQSTAAPKLVESGRPNKNTGKAHASWRRRGEPVNADGEGDSGGNDGGQFQTSELAPAPLPGGEKQSRGRRPPFRSHRASENWEPAAGRPDACEEAPRKRVDHLKSQWQLKSTTVNGSDQESTWAAPLSSPERKPFEKKDKIAVEAPPPPQRRHHHQGQRQVEDVEPRPRPQHGPDGLRYRERAHRGQPQPRQSQLTARVDPQ
ncbi:modifier of snc1 [Wolffia australiana]